jgi:hypothetical protein
MYNLEQLNKMKNMISKTVGMKMKVSQIYPRPALVFVGSFVSTVFHELPNVNCHNRGTHRFGSSAAQRTAK